MVTYKIMRWLSGLSVCVMAQSGVAATVDMDAKLQSGSTDVVSSAAPNGQSSSAKIEVVLQDQTTSLDQAVAKMEAKYRARAVRYNTVEEEGRQVHYIRLITTDRARVFTVNVDAATGREMPIRE